MTPGTLVRRSLTHFWRTNLAVMLGVGVAVASLAGALLVGESVRRSLREMALARLGNTGQIVTATLPFTEQLAERLTSTPNLEQGARGATPVLALEGIVIHEPSGRRAGGVQVFGVDDRFWAFHGVASVTGPTNRSAFLSSGLARELDVSGDDSLLLRIQRPSAMPAGILQGRRDEPGRAVRLRSARVLSREEMGDFSPRPQQGEARTVFVPLERLQRDLELPHKINMMLFAASAGAADTGTDTSTDLIKLVEQKIDLADLGVKIRPVEPPGGAGPGGPALVVESDAGYLPEALAKGAGEAAQRIGVEPVPMLTYLANAIRANGRDIPYSLVAGLPRNVIETAVPRSSASSPASPADDLKPAPATDGSAKSIWLSQWAADDLAARVGDHVTLDYYVWSDDEGLTSSTADFTVAGIVPMTGIATDPDLTPEYPGVSGSANIGEWDPPFPVDLKRVRPKDEDFWDDYRTSPKAFVALEDAQALWRTRYGQYTALRVPAGERTVSDVRTAFAEELPRHVPPAIGEFRAMPVRAEALSAATGTTDFGEYFTYFSFFLVVSSLLLAMLFFRLGVEQRASHVGLMSALGFAPREISRLLLAEGSVLAVVGAAIGVLGAIAYSALIMIALRTLWVDAVGTTALQLHPSALPLVLGAIGGIVAAIVCITWSLRVISRASVRQLMSGGWLDPKSAAAASGSTLRWVAVAAALAAGLLVAATAAGLTPDVAGFFTSGTLLLIAGLCAFVVWLRRPTAAVFAVRSWPLARLGVRTARYRPARSVLSAALIAAATFLIVAVGAFRRGAEDVVDRHSGSGGYSLIAETLAPLLHDPSTERGREALGLESNVAGLDVARFRLRSGDDASCLNLYRPKNPRLLGATDAFMQANRFAFSAVLGGDSGDNGWLLLNRRFDDGAVPVIGDATSLAYVFHLGVGDDYVMQGPDGQPLRLRIVGALRDSVLQSELVMSEAHFTRLFPRLEGYRVFLVGTTPERSQAVAAALEDRLEDFGMDVQSTSERLASYHRVENTYLSTFQALGALGLVLGTLGLGTVLLRNVLEQRQQLALLRAAGYRRSHLIATVMAESAFLLASGLALGVVSALVAIAPAFAGRGQAFPFVLTLALLAAVFGAGLLSSVLAVRAVSSSTLLPALRNE